ncbi:MAG: AAA family ATPase [Myxococcales bacterium]|nr:AAA family ATPase [Myxococcales bacterium]
MHAYMNDIFEGGVVAWEDALEACGEQFPLLHEMAKTPQDPEWHAEGDVAIHTGMVLDRLSELLSMGGWKLSPERWFALWVGTWLHDIGKPMTTREQDFDGRLRIVAPHHAPRGASYAFYRLLDLGIPLRLALDIAALIGLHHEPKRFVKKEFGTAKQWMLAESCDVQLLYLLEKADMMGRICPDQDEQIEIMELFRMLFEESGTWSGAGLLGDRRMSGWSCARGGFAASELYEMLGTTFRGEGEMQLERLWRESLWDLAEGTISRPEEAVARSYGRVASARGALTILFGPSASGKSSWLNEHARDAVVISMDQMREEITGDAANQSENTRVLHQARDRLKEALRKGQHAIWDATSLRRDSRSMLVQIARDYHAHTSIVLFCAPMKEIFRRNRQRERQVPPGVLKRQFETLEWPGFHEAHQQIFVGEDGQVAYDTRWLLRGL